MSNESELFSQIKEILNKAPCGMGMFEIGTSKPLFLNKAYYEMIGVSRENWTTKSTSRSIQPRCVRQ